MSEPINWEDFGVYQYPWRTYAEPLPEDMIHVVTIDSSGGYDWTTFHAFWLPSAKRYYWHGGAGCSCNSWSDDIRSLSSFEDGDKDALFRGIRSFCERYDYAVSPYQLLDALQMVHDFNHDNIDTKE